MSMPNTPPMGAPAPGTAPAHSAPRPVTFTLNGSPVTVLVPPMVTLLITLRTQLQLTGSKIGCARGECGACTVLLDGQPVYSCLLLTVECEGRSVETIESLRAAGPDGAPHPVPAAVVEEDGLQCGFCTPGQVMSLVALLRRTPDPDDDEIREALSGNLCRCGAYLGLMKAARHAAAVMRGQSPARDAGPIRVAVEAASGKPVTPKRKPSSITPKKRKR